MSLNREPGQAAGKPAKGRTALRRAARTLAVQALYQWHMAGQSLTEIEAQFRVDNDFSSLDSAYFHELFTGVAKQKPELDQLLAPLLDRDLTELDPVELAILRQSSYELRHRLDVPYRVVINEGIELAKVFGATDSHRFINGVLDRLALSLRDAEVRSRR